MRLLTCESPDEIQQVIKEYENEAEQLVAQITEILWYMRGGVTREEAWMMSPKEREKASNLINENIERTKESGMPLL